MKRPQMKWITLVFILGTIMMLGACKKNKLHPRLRHRRHRPAPTASLSANPNSIDKGMSTTLTWQTTLATDVSIDGIGAVQPTVATSYSDRVDDLSPGRERCGGIARSDRAGHGKCCPGRHHLRHRRRQAKRSCSRKHVRDIYFDYDTDSIRPDQQTSVQGDAQFLSQHPNSSSRWEDTATSAARPNTTWPSATGARTL